MPWWRFWKPETEAEITANQLQKESIYALENGDIPPLAKKRLQDHIARQDSFFSSDLTVREFLLTKESGIRPISQVLGTSFYNVSFWGSYTGPWRSTGELVKITEAQVNARKLAISRMTQEAKILGATGVIGVRIVAKPSNMGSRMTEFTAYGTAVSIPDYPRSEEPFTSDLNGQDFWQLYKAGYRPKGLCMGLCSYYIYTNWRASMQMGGLFGFGNFKNQEVDLYTLGFNQARDRAQNRLSMELTELAADGAVGMTITHHIERIEYGSENSRQVDLLITFMALGTAVTAGPAQNRSSPLICIDLSKGKNKELSIAFQ